MSANLRLTDVATAEAFALRLARAAAELSALRSLLTAHASAPYASAGCPGTVPLGAAERAAFEALDLSGDDVVGALMSVASRLDRDLGSKL
jgi:hypothetical protein